MTLNIKTTLLNNLKKADSKTTISDLIVGQNNTVRGLTQFKKNYKNYNKLGY